MYRYASVEWINRAYRNERTVTTVTLDARAGTVVAAVDVRVVLAVPRPFRLVPKVGLYKFANPVDPTHEHESAWFQPLNL